MVQRRRWVDLNGNRIARCTAAVSPESPLRASDDHRRIVLTSIVRFCELCRCDVADRLKLLHTDGWVALPTRNCVRSPRTAHTSSALIVFVDVLARVITSLLPHTATCAIIIGRHSAACCLVPRTVALVRWAALPHLRTHHAPLKSRGPVRRSWRSLP